MGTIGICHICGEDKELTDEHVPPSAAFNSNTSWIQQGAALKHLIGSDYFPWQYPSVSIKTVRRKHMQGGVRFKTLCKECNNHKTGHWYAPAYVDFVAQGYSTILQYRGYSNMNSNDRYTFNFSNIYPLSVIKQIFAMFCSINPPKFASKDDGLIRNFLLSRDSKSDLSKKYAVYLFINKGSIVRYVGDAAINNFEKNEVRQVSEMTIEPFSIVLEMDPIPKYSSSPNNIVNFAYNYEYGEKADLKIQIPVFECHSVLPLDYRTQSEIFFERLKNRLNEMLEKDGRNLFKI